MSENVVSLRVRRRLPQSESPAECYRFSGDITASQLTDRFLTKAAAFREIRDCLAAADRQKLSTDEAERRIRFYVREYFAIDHVG